jgi:hypothetical protein
MYPVVAYVARAVVPMPVPVVVKAVWIEREHRGRTSPGIEVDARRNRAVFFVTDMVAELHIPRLGHQRFADFA